MLGLAQKAIGIVQNMVFLVGQTAGPFEGLHGEQRIPLPQLGQIAAVKEL